MKESTSTFLARYRRALNGQPRGPYRLACSSALCVALFEIVGPAEVSDCSEM